MAFDKESEVIENVYPPIICHLSVKIYSLNDIYNILNESVCPYLKVHSIPNFSLEILAQTISLNLLSLLCSIIWDTCYLK